MSSTLDPNIEESFRLIQHICGSITLPFNSIVLLLIILDGDSRSKDYRKYLCCLQITSMATDLLSDIYAPIVLSNKGLLYSDSYLANYISLWNFNEIELTLLAEITVVYFACVYYRRGVVLSNGRHFNYFGGRRAVLFVTMALCMLFTVRTVLYFQKKSIDNSESLMPSELYWVRERTTYMYMLPDGNNIIADCVVIVVLVAIISAIVIMLLQIASEVKRGMQWSSKATRRYQLLALRSLVLQGTVPTLLLSVPACGMAYLQFAKAFFAVDDDFDRSANVICPMLYIIMTRHAFVGSLTILYCSPSYRQRMWSMRRFTHSSVAVSTRTVERTKDSITQISK